ncbi:MAG: hypothetical protein CSA07_00450 [Bacteroidia bacterium]|nr:MAG: hypothetical protein CSA07_00450 [Bacteroidia bacterium]
MSHSKPNAEHPLPPSSFPSFTAEIVALHDAGRPAEALAYFKQHKAHFTHRQIADEPPLLVAMLRSLIDTHQLRAALVFEQLYIPEATPDVHPDLLRALIAVYCLLLQEGWTEGDVEDASADSAAYLARLDALEALEQEREERRAASALTSSSPDLSPRVPEGASQRASEPAPSMLRELPEEFQGLHVAELLRVDSPTHGALRWRGEEYAYALSGNPPYGAQLRVGVAVRIVWVWKDGELAPQLLGLAPR